MALTTITNAMVSVNAIQGTLIADNAITAVHIATNAVSGTLVADNAITATHIAQNTITVTQIADDAIESAKIADGIITTNHLNKAMISSQTEVAVATGDFILLGDTSDSNNLKKAPISSILAGTLTTAAQTNITSVGTLTTLTVDDITINGSTISDSGDLDFDVGGEIKLDSDGEIIRLYHAGTQVGAFHLNNDDFAIRAMAQDKDIIFKGYDASSNITALTLDMSDLGSAKFNGPNLNITADDARLLVEEADGTNIGWFGDITGAGVGGCFLYNHGGTATVQIRADATAGFINNGANFGIGTASPTAPLTVSGTGTGNIVEIISTDAGASTAPDLSFYRNSSSAADSDNIGLIRFYGNDDGGNKTSYAAIHGYIADASDGSSDGGLIFSTTRADTQAPTGAAEALRITQTGDQKLTGGQDLYVDLFADSGSSQGSGSFRFLTDGSSTEQSVAGIVMQQEDGTSRKGEILFQVSDNGNPATALKIFNNKDVQVDGRIASYYDGTDHVAIRGLSGGQYIQYGSGRALTFMRIDTYPNSGATHTMSLSGSKVRIGSDSPSRDGLLSVEGSNAGVSALYVRNAHADSVGIRVDVNNNNAGNHIYSGHNSDGQKWKIRNDGDHQGSDTSIGSISDSRTKKDVASLTYDIAKFKQYRPVTFNWINPECHNNKSNNRGFIAQEVKAIDDFYTDKYESQGDDIPLVDEDGMAHSTKFGYKDAMYISVIKQLITRLETAEAKIAVLEG